MRKADDEKQLEIQRQEELRRKHDEKMRQEDEKRRNEELRRQVAFSVLLSQLLYIHMYI